MKRCVVINVNAFISPRVSNRLRKESPLFFGIGIFFVSYRLEYKVKFKKVYTKLHRNIINSAVFREINTCNFPNGTIEELLSL